MDEKEVTAVLRIINQNCGIAPKYAGSCGWADEPTKWFILFHATKKQYYNIVNELANIGKVEIKRDACGRIYI
jgi:hypothetical protein